MSSPSTDELLEACRRAGRRDADDIVELEQARDELRRQQIALLRLGAKLADAQVALDTLEALLMRVLRGWSSGDAALAMLALDEFFVGDETAAPRRRH